MFVADDPLLACIVRFVQGAQGGDSDNVDFLRLQIKALRRYLVQFPTEEQDDKAMEWVARHAADYRRYWQRRTISEQTWALRCEDCPIAGRGTAEHCEIHEQWLYLLRRYMLGEIRSRDYVERALSLLQANKDALACRRPPLPADAERTDALGARLVEGSKVKCGKPKTKDARSKAKGRKNAGKKGKRKKQLKRRDAGAGA
jgi:hypothetical protein